LDCKKGNAIVDTTFVIVVLFLFAFFIVMGKVLFTSMDNTLGDYFANEGGFEANATWAGNRDAYSSNMDAAFLLVFVALWILVLVASFQIDSHPIFFVITLALLIVVFLASAMVSNMWDSVATSTSLLTAAVDTFPMMNFILDNLLTFMIFIGASIALVLFGKQQLT